MEGKDGRRTLTKAYVGNRPRGRGVRLPREGDIIHQVQSISFIHQVLTGSQLCTSYCSRHSQSSSPPPQKVCVPYTNPWERHFQRRWEYALIHCSGGQVNTSNRISLSTECWPRQSYSRTDSKDGDIREDSLTRNWNNLSNSNQAAK